MFPKEALDNINLMRLIRSADIRCRAAVRTQIASAWDPAEPQKARHITGLNNRALEKVESLGSGSHDIRQNLFPQGHTC